MREKTLNKTNIYMCGKTYRQNIRNFFYFFGLNALFTPKVYKSYNFGPLLKKMAKITPCLSPFANTSYLFFNPHHQ